MPRILDGIPAPALENPRHLPYSVPSSFRNLSNVLPSHNLVQSKQVPGNALSSVLQADLQATREAHAQHVDGGLLHYFPSGHEPKEKVADRHNAVTEGIKDEVVDACGKLLK
jgi:hypothetical protein